MALLQTVLKKNILDAYSEASKIKDAAPGTPPNVPQKVAELFADAYDSYAKSVMPGPLVFVTPPSKIPLSAALTAPLLAGWAPGLVSYWTPATFSGPGLIPVNPIFPASLITLPVSIVSGISLIMSQAASGIFPASMEASADQIATILHAATLTLQVMTTTTSVPPIIAPVPFG